LKKMILLAVVALLVLGVLGGAGIFAMKWFAAQNAAKAAAAPAAAAAAVAQPDAAKDDDEDEPPAAGGGEGAAPPPVMMLGPLIVNLESSRQNAFLKCDLSILFRNPELGKLATSDKPTPENSIVRAMVLEALSGKTVEEAGDVETRETIRQDIKDKLNAKFASWNRTPEALAAAQKSGKPPKPPVKDVLVIDWAIQQ
jgi:flagellar basal body-associated protein FliL